MNLWMYESMVIWNHQNIELRKHERMLVCFYIYPRRPLTKWSGGMNNYPRRRIKGVLNRIRLSQKARKAECGANITIATIPKGRTINFKW